jgi:hypothetical protein
MTSDILSVTLVHLCPLVLFTYPSRLVVPTRVSDATLQYGVKYRSKGRMPTLTYLHKTNFVGPSRISQTLERADRNSEI